MLNGTEKIKDIADNDIGNYLGFKLCKAKKVGIRHENYGNGDYRVLYIEYEDGIKIRISFNSDRANNTSIEDIKRLALFMWKEKKEGFIYGSKN